MKGRGANCSPRETSVAVKHATDFLEIIASHLRERVNNFMSKKRYGDPGFRIWYSYLRTETSGITQAVAFFHTYPRATEFLDVLLADKMLVRV
jgi:hypothetical protein